MKGSRVRHRALQAAPDAERSGRRIFSIRPCRSPCSSHWGMSLRTRTAPLRRRRGRPRQPLFAPVAVRAGCCTRQGALSTGAFPRPALLASVKGTPAKKKAPEVAAGARSCAEGPAVKYGRGAGAPARRRVQSGSTHWVRSIPRLGCAQARHLGRLMARPCVVPQDGAQRGLFCLTAPPPR